MSERCDRLAVEDGPDEISHGVFATACPDEATSGESVVPVDDVVAETTRSVGTGAGQLVACVAALAGEAEVVGLLDMDSVSHPANVVAEEMGSEIEAAKLRLGVAPEMELQARDGLERDPADEAGVAAAIPWRGHVLEGDVGALLSRVLAGDARIVMVAAPGAAADLNGEESEEPTPAAEEGAAPPTLATDHVGSLGSHPVAVGYLFGRQVVVLQPLTDPVLELVWAIKEAAITLPFGGVGAANDDLAVIGIRDA